MKIKLIALLFALLPSASFSQNKKEYNLLSMLQENKLTVGKGKVVPADDPKVKAVKLEGIGVAWVNDINFSSGTIEVDLKGKDIFQQSFLGIAFHGVNDSTYDAIYFRPFNFHATDPVRKIHAVQYINHPIYTWSKLREEKNGIYEKALVNPPDPNGWFHARIEITGDQVSVFVNDDKVPSLTVSKISTIRNGKLGIWTGGGEGGEFANLVIVKK